MTLDSKFTQLKDNLRGLERVIIAYSGGVDSTLLLKAASVAGLEKVLAVTASSETLPREELSSAREIALSLNVEHRIITTEELSDKNFSDNPPDRCYYCKKELFGRLKGIALKENFLFVLDGTNADDVRDHRPGRRAAGEAGVRSPLMDAGLGKEDIREISRALGLPTWNKPAAPCLSSRFPYGQKITSEGLERLSRAENFLRRFGFAELRVRDHSGIARIEVLPQDFTIFMERDVREEIITFLKKLGYTYIALDLQGFRSGSLNEVIGELNKKDEGS